MEMVSQANLICTLHWTNFYASLYFKVSPKKCRTISFSSHKSQIAGQRLADQIPLVIRYQMLQKSTAQLQRAMMQMLQDKEKTETLLLEDFGIQTTRSNLKDRFRRLSRARILLTEFSMNIYNFNTTPVQNLNLDL